MARLFVSSIFVFLYGCTSTTQLSGTHINFQVANGYYERFQVSTWSPEENICVQMVVNSSNFGKQWYPIAGLSFEDEAEIAMYKLELTPELNRSTVSLVSRYRIEKDDKIERIILKTGLKYGEIIDLKFELIEKQILKISGNELEKSVDLNFEPKSLFIGASSIKASIGYTEDNCPQNGKL